MEAAGAAAGADGLLSGAAGALLLPLLLAAVLPLPKNEPKAAFPPAAGLAEEALDEDAGLAELLLLDPKNLLAALSILELLLLLLLLLLAPAPAPLALPPLLLLPTSAPSIGGALSRVADCMIELHVMRLDALVRYLSPSGPLS